MSTAFNSDVDVAVEIGFGSDPYATSPTWTDISSKVRRFSITRGRSHSLTRVSASKLTVEVDNYDGAFDPTYTSGTYYPNVVPMVPIRVVATYSVTDYPLFYGFVRAWPMEWTRDNKATVTIHAEDGMFLLNMLTSSTAQSQEASGTRIGNLLDDASWPAGWRNLATGDVTCSAYTPSCGNILSLIRSVEDTEAGLFFIAGDGDATFQDQTHRSGATPVLTFGDSGAETRYESVSMQLDELQVFNVVEVTPLGGTVETSSNTASSDAYGARELSVIDTLHTSQANAKSLADALLARLKDPHVVVESLELQPARSGDWADVLGLELSDLVTVKRRPAGAGNTVDLDVYVESIQTTVDPSHRLWRTRLSGTQYV